MNSQSRHLHPLGETSINNGANQEGSIMKACFKRSGILALATMAIVCMILGPAFTGYKDIKLATDSLTSAAIHFLILTFFCGLFLASYVFFMYDRMLRVISNWQCMLHVVLVSFNGVIVMCTHVFLLALVNRVNALLACFLVPFIIGMLAYAGNRINGTDQLSRDQAFEAALKSCSDVAYLTFIGAFSMQQAILSEYYKNPSLRVNQLPSLDLSVTFLASELGVFSVMVTAMPLELLPLAVRSKLLQPIKYLKNSMLILTAAAAMTIGLKFLDGLIVLALMPILVVKVIDQAVLLFAEERVGPDLNSINEEPEIPIMLTGVTTICILLLSAVYAFYHGGKNGDVYLKGGVLVIVTIITSSLNWIAFLLMPSMNKQNKQQANVTNLVSGILLLLEIITAASLLLKIYVDLYNQT